MTYKYCQVTKILEIVSSNFQQYSQHVENNILRRILFVVLFVYLLSLHAYDYNYKTAYLFTFVFFAFLHKTSYLRISINNHNGLCTIK